MRLAVIVTEYPKVTETFILRDLLEFNQAGCEVRLFHLVPYRTSQLLHDFAKPTRAWARYHRFADKRSVGALLRALIRRPRQLVRIVWQTLTSYKKEPVRLVKSLALIPKSLAISEELLNWGADHVHAEFAGHPATCAWIIGRVSGLPYSVSCRAHDIFISQSLLDTKLREASFVRTISEFNRKFLAERTGIPAERIEVIHSSVDIAAIRPLDRPTDGPFHIVYVGSLRKHKGVDVLFRALASARAELGDWCCEVLGGGEERERLEKLSVHLGLAAHVTFLGDQDFNQVTRAYGRANVVVAPSTVGESGRTEGIPNVMIEALAHQRPAISTRVSGIPELIEDDRTGWLVSPGSVEELSAALIRAKSDPDRAFEIAKAGREKVEREFDLTRNAAAQLSLFARYSARPQAVGAE